MPVPELVTVPELLMARPEIVMPFVIVLLLLLRIRLPVPMIPPETVRSAVVPLAALLLKLVPPAPFTVMAVVDSVSGEVALLSVTAVTLLPTPPLIVVAAAPVPEFVMAPVTFSGLVEIVIPPVAALLLRVRFPGAGDAAGDCQRVSGYIRPRLAGAEDQRSGDSEGACARIDRDAVRAARWREGERIRAHTGSDAGRGGPAHHEAIDGGVLAEGAGKVPGAGGGKIDDAARERYIAETTVPAASVVKLVANEAFPPFQAALAPPFQYKFPAVWALRVPETETAAEVWFSVSV